MAWQTEQLNTVDVVAGQEQTFQVLVPSTGRYVLENIGVEAVVGLWNGPTPVKGQNGLLGICGTNVKGTHNNTPAGVLSVTVRGTSQTGSTQVRLRKFTILDWWWSIPGITQYKSTCSIAGG